MSKKSVFNSLGLKKRYYENLWNLSRSLIKNWIAIIKPVAHKFSYFSKLESWISSTIVLYEIYD